MEKRDCICYGTLDIHETYKMLLKYKEPKYFLEHGKQISLNTRCLNNALVSYFVM